MRKSINLFLCFSIISCLSTNLYSQSAVNELDQVELMKQFIGEWVTQWSEETVVTWDISPSGDGYEFTISWESEGSPLRLDHGVIGFSSDGVPTMAFLWSSSSEGLITCDYGKFESRNKMITNRYDKWKGEEVMIFEYEFLSPDKMKMVMKSKVPGETWDQADVSELIFEKHRPG
jgi:hypothetical protein